MANYSQDAKDALADLTEAGVELVLSRPKMGAFNPVLGSVDYASDFLTLHGIIKSPKTFRGNTGYDQTLEDAARIGRAKVFYCAAYGLQFVPQVGDLVPLNGISYKVHAVTTLEPGGIPIAHNLTLLQE